MRPFQGEDQHNVRQVGRRRVGRTLTRVPCILRGSLPPEPTSPSSPAHRLCTDLHYRPTRQEWEGHRQQRARRRVRRRPSSPATYLAAVRHLETDDASRHSHDDEARSDVELAWARCHRSLHQCSGEQTRASWIGAERGGETFLE